MTRRSRILGPDERELWARVARSALPIHPPRHDLPLHDTRPEPRPPAAPAWPKPRALPADFRPGMAARPPVPAHDLPATIEERLAHQPLRMDRKTHQQMQRGKLSPEGRIDLHGLTLTEAHPELIRFILAAQAAGKRLVLVITGKGRIRDDHGPIPQRAGILRHQVPQWLIQPPLGGVVMQIAPAHLRHGGSGAYYVYLRRGTAAGQPR